MTRDEANLRSAKDGPYRVVATRHKIPTIAPGVMVATYGIYSGDDLLCTLTHKETADMLAAAPDTLRELIELRSKCKRIEGFLEEAREELRVLQEEGSTIRAKMPVEIA